MHMPEKATVFSTGTPVQLGDLYDIRAHDSVDVEVPLWSKDEIDRATHTQHLAPSVTLAIMKDLTATERMERMDLTVQQKFSILSSQDCVSSLLRWGLNTCGIKTEKTSVANYVTSFSRKQSFGSVTFEYNAMTNFKELNILDLAHPPNYEFPPKATHVIVGIRYGARFHLVCRGGTDTQNLTSPISGSSDLYSQLIDSQKQLQAQSAAASAIQFAAKPEPFTYQYFGDIRKVCEPKNVQDASNFVRGLRLEDMTEIPIEVYMLPLAMFWPKLELPMAKTEDEGLVEVCSYIMSNMDGINDANDLRNSMDDEDESGMITNFIESLHNNLDKYTKSVRSSYLKASSDFMADHRTLSSDTSFTRESIENSLDKIQSEVTIREVLPKILDHLNPDEHLADIERFADKLTCEIQDIWQKYQEVKDWHRLIESGVRYQEVTRTRFVNKERSAASCVTWCIRCDYLCHDNCAITDDNEKEGCAVMTNSYCTQCPARCHWREHRNRPFDRVPEKYTEWIIIDDVASSYNESSSEVGFSKRMDLHIKHDLQFMQQRTTHNLVYAYEALRKLERQRAGANRQSFEEFIDSKINAERRRGNEQLAEHIKASRDPALRLCRRRNPSFGNDSQLQHQGLNENPRSWNCSMQ